MNPRRRTAFTLVELLAVVALTATVVALGVACLRGGGAGPARDAAVALLAAQVMEVRSLAVDRGQPARLMVHADPARPELFLRFVTIMVDDAGGWRRHDDGSILPGDAVVLPPEGLGETGPGVVRRSDDDWTRGSGGALRSTALRSYISLGETAPVMGTTQWFVVHFSPTGGVFGGDLVVTTARRHDGTPPITLVCENPENVAGLSLSSYGVATFGRGRAEF